MHISKRTTQLQVLFVSTLIAISSVAAFSLESASETGKNANAEKARLVESYARLPLSFAANTGQTDGRVRFLSRGDGYGIFLTNQDAVLALSKHACRLQSGSIAPRAESGANLEGCKKETAVVGMRLTGGTNTSASPQGEGQLPGTANYFVGSDAAAWRAAVPTFAKVRYQAVYPGVDVVYYGNQRQLEYDFAVAPNADPSAIRLQFSGVAKLKLNADGDLVLTAKAGEISFQKPVVYQERNGRRELIDGRFTLGRRHTVGFKLGNYDHSQPMIIDPVLVYSTYVGGSGTDGDGALALAVDSSGNAYITGQTDSSNFPLTSGAVQATDEATASTAYNAFVTKLNAAGTAVVYSTYLGGSGNTQGTGIAVDSSGDAYVTGHTFSTNFPTTSGAFQPASIANATGYTAFVSKLNPAGTALTYSTYLGGGGNGGGTGESTYGIAVNSAGDAYVTGYTYSSNFPTTTGAYQTTNKATVSTASDAFVTELNSSGSGLVFSTYLGGSGQHDGGDIGYGLAVNSAGDVYVTGQAGSTDFPTTSGAYLTTNPASASDGTAAFIAEVNPTGAALVYSTYLGGSVGSAGAAIAVDGSGNAYVTGYSLDANFPVTSGAFQSTNLAAPIDSTTAFVTKINPTGTALVYSTLLGGSGISISTVNTNGDSADGIQVDAAGDAYVTGMAYSTNFPVTSNALQSTNAGASTKSFDAFLTELNPAGTALVYSSYLGGSGNVFGEEGYYRGDCATGLALDSSDNVYIAGVSFSGNFPVTSGAYQSSNLAASTSGSNAFVSKISLAPAVATSTAVASSANPQSKGGSVTFTATVTPGSGTTEPTGSVVFTVDGSTAATETLGASGTATYATTTLAAGTHTVTATFGGSGAFAASTSGSLIETISEPTASAPAFSPAVGTYTASQSVKLSSSTSGASIYYTTNGTTPTTSSTKYSSAITVSGAETIEAIAVASGYNNSVVASGTYTIETAAAAPTFSVAAGTYTATQSVTLADKTSGATIYYTTNGTTPTTSSTKYSGAMSVNATETIEAIAVATGYSNSATASAKYTIETVAATPTFSVAAGTYTAKQTVTLADTTTGATIYYTTNGTTPTASSTKYSSAISVSATETIEAFAVATGYTNSAVASAKYTINLPTAATPTFSVGAGTYTATQSVKLADTTTGATIYYTTNGTTPTTSSTKYTAAISVTASETIEAIAVASGYNNSAVASAKYTINIATLAAPTFSPAAGTYTASQSLKLADATSGATIYYTTNGTTPTTSSSKYSAAIPVTQTETVEAIAVASGYSNSAVVSAKYTIN